MCARKVAAAAVCRSQNVVPLTLALGFDDPGDAAMMKTRGAWILALLAVACISPLATLASPGDRSLKYRKCVEQCEKESCRKLGSKSGVWTNPSAINALMQWDCPSECSYSCTVSHSLERQAAGLPVTKYYGKWPFSRVLGFQELISSLTSAGNGLVHVYYLCLGRAVIRPVWPPRMPSYRGGMSYLLFLLNVACINSWLWSTVFHARDTPATERLDYLCATSQVVFSTYVCVVRLFLYGQVRPWFMSVREAASPPGVTAPALLLLFTCCAFSLYCRHMLYVSFDYGLHMKINTALLLSSLLLWNGWFFGLLVEPGRSSLSLRPRRPYFLYGQIFLFGVLLASLFEVLDFPPLSLPLVVPSSLSGVSITAAGWCSGGRRSLFSGLDVCWTGALLDAHASWHFLTMWLIPFWYSFWEGDCKEEERRERERKHDGGKRVEGGGEKKEETASTSGRHEKTE